MKLYDGYKQFVWTETTGTWSNVNTFIGSSQHVGQLCRLQKTICKKVMGAGSLEVTSEFMKNP